MTVASRVLTLAVASMALLTGCGPTFVRKEVTTELAGDKRYGVVVAKYRANLGNNEQALAARVLLTTETTATASAAGFSSKPLLGDDLRVVMDRFGRLPENWGGLAVVDESSSLGDLSQLFRNNSIDAAFILSGSSVICRPWVGLATSAAQLGIGLATSGAILSGGGCRPTTMASLTVVTPDGRVIYHDREQFTRSGNLTDQDERQSMIKSLVRRFAKAVKQ